MKNKIVFIVGVLFAANVVYSIGQYCPVPNKNGGYIHNGLKSANSRSSVDDDAEKLVWKEGNILKQMENERQLKNQCKKLEIRFLQRPLSMDKNGDFQNMSDGTISHIQIVAYDKVTGEYYDDFGYSFRNSILKEEKGMVFSEGEKQVRKLYNKNEPLGIIEVDSDDYEKIKKASVEKLESIYYAPLNSVDVKSYVMEGTVKGVGLGAAVGGINSVAMGAISGGLSAASEYSKDGRGNYKIVSDDKAQMSIPGVNCQTAADIVVEIGEWLFRKNEIRSWNVLEKYVQPGPYSANSKKKESDEKTDADEEKDSNDKGKAPESVTVDTKDDGGVGVRGWCKCVNNGDDVIAVGFGKKTSKANYSDEEYEWMENKFKTSKLHHYVYFICKQCGRCNSKGKMGGDGPLKNICIFDLTLAAQFEDEKKKKTMSSSDRQRHNAMMIGVDQKLLAIPDGQIVIPGSCFCLKPDLITVGLTTSDKFQVCRYCGRKWVSAKE